MLLYTCQREVTLTENKLKRQEIVMKKISKRIMEAAAKVGMNTAAKACGCASLYGCHQPKEPKALKEIAK